MLEQIARAQQLCRIDVALKAADWKGYGTSMIKIRPVMSSDLAIICGHRDAMFREAGTTEADVASMSPTFAAWLQPRLEDGRYFGFIAEGPDGTPIGGVGLMEIDWPPHPFHPADASRGYVLNVYVASAHRGQGIAQALMVESDRAFRDRNINYAILHATDAGRPLYERIGWTRTSEMAKRFD
ncbi:MAG: GNAT family N-acetyltransferase [Sphingomonas sp.]